MDQKFQIHFMVRRQQMKKQFLMYFLLGLVGMLVIALSACGPLPAGAEAEVAADGQSAKVEFTGTVSDIQAAQWVIEGQTILINSLTIIDPTVMVGNLVKVHAIVLLDGSITAEKIELYVPDNSPTETPGNGSSDPPGVGEKEDNLNGQLEMIGIVESIATDQWVIAGMTFLITPSTELNSLTVVGDTVEVEFLSNNDGTLTALEINLLKDGFDEEIEEYLETEGIVESMDATSWTISGVVYLVTSETDIDSGIVLGDMVDVEFIKKSDGSFTAREICLEDSGSDSDSDSKSEDGEVAGIVDNMTETSWTIGGVVYLVTSETDIDSGIVLGDMVDVEFIKNSDGSFTAKDICLPGSDSDGNGNDSTGNYGIGNGNTGEHGNGGNGNGEDSEEDDD
jgi:hypothetical protein